MFESEIFTVEGGVLAGALELPGGYVGEVLVVTQRLPLRGLVFLAEVASA
jgi:hypothetical protein